MNISDITTQLIREATNTMFSGRKGELSLFDDLLLEYILRTVK